MKKTLIALAVVTSAAVSSSAMADLGSFAAKNTTNTVTVGGTITPTVTKNTWVWSVGQGVDNLNVETKNMTDNYTTFTHSAAQDIPILVGKTTAAFAGGPAVAPNITWNDAKGGVNPVWGTDNAEGTVDLSVIDGESNKIGTMTLNVQGLGVYSGLNIDGSASLTGHYSDGSKGAFYHDVGVFAAAKQSVSTIDAILIKFGAPTLQDVMQQAANYNSVTLAHAKEAASISEVSAHNSMFDASSNNAYAGAYVLGIPANQDIKVVFDEQITKETHWTAPLKLSIAYQ